MAKKHILIMGGDWLHTDKSGVRGVHCGVKLTESKSPADAARTLRRLAAEIETTARREPTRRAA